MKISPAYSVLPLYLDALPLSTYYQVKKFKVKSLEKQYYDLADEKYSSIL